MNEILKQVIKEETEKLSKEGQEAVNSLDWVKITEEIGQKYLLDESEIEDLQIQTLLVLIGLRDAGLYMINVENKLWTNNKEKAEKIAEEVFQKIFTPIGNIIIENIKKSGKDKNANAEQNLDFILSGGDYSAFAAPARADVPPPLSGGGGISPSPEGLSLGLGPKLRSGVGERLSTPQGGNKPRIDDLRSKFTI